MQITIDIPSEHTAEVSAALDVTTVAEFKAHIATYIKNHVVRHRRDIYDASMPTHDTLPEDIVT